MERSGAIRTDEAEHFDPMLKRIDARFDALQRQMQIGGAALIVMQLAVAVAVIVTRA